MAPDPSIWNYIADAGFVVKIVMLILLLASISSWTLIFQRFSLLKRVQKQIQGFEKEFWSGASLPDLFQKTSKNSKGIVAVFRAGYNEYQLLSKTAQSAPEIMSGIKRAMHIATRQELDKLEQNVSFLATVGSTSPYIGLFGTVWGIMTAFSALGTVQQASIAMVAPGISEALVATAIGLFAAIPAVIAYNRFSTQLTRIDDRYELFQEEFISLLQREN